MISEIFGAIGGVAKAIGAFFGWKQNQDTLQAGQAEQKAADLDETAKALQRERDAAQGTPNTVATAEDNLDKGKF